MTPSRAMLASGMVPALLAAILAITRPDALTRLDLSAYDHVLRAAPLTPPGDRVVIVDVDEASLGSIGQWPWRRDIVAGLIDRLREHGAAIIALDIIFAEADRYEGAGASPDATLARSLARGRVVLGYAMTFDTVTQPATPCVQHPLGLAVIRRDDADDHQPFFEATGSVCSLQLLTAAAGASGFLNAAPDPDGILRRAPLLVEFDHRVYPSIGLAAASRMSGGTEAALHVDTVNRAELIVSGDEADGSGDGPARGISVPLDGQSNLLLRYRGPRGTFQYLSAADVIAGRIPDGALRDKLVLVGTTALGTREVVSTPLDTLFTGVEVQATIADNLLHGDFIARPASGPAAEAGAALLLGLMATLLAVRWRIAWSAVAVLGALAAIWAASVWAFAADGVFLSPLYPSLAGAGTLVSLTVVGLVVERRRADRAGEAQAASQRLMVQTLLSLTEIKDVETGRHSRRTQQYTRVLAHELARHPAYRDYLTPERVDLLATLAPLHDIGKVGVPDRVLNKPGALTPEELAEMRKHPIHGRDVIVNAERDAGVRDDLTLSIAKDIVYTHHEKWDGSGYPEGLRGTDIPIPGRIMAIVDVYDACTTRRLYTPSLSQDEAVALIVKGRGTHFDPNVVDAFLAVAPVFRSLSAHTDAA